MDGQIEGTTMTRKLKVSGDTLDAIKDMIREALTELGQKGDMEWAKSAQVREIDLITPQEQRVVDAMNWLQNVSGKTAFHPVVIAFFAKHAAESTSFGNAKRGLRRKGFIENTYAGHMQLTELGMSHSKCYISIGPKTVEKTRAGHEEHA